MERNFYSHQVSCFPSQINLDENRAVIKIKNVKYMTHTALRYEEQALL